MDNETFGWLWIVLGFISGLILGMRFHQEEWLGGYSSQPRRLIRLGHISFLGLGFINILFFQTLGRVHLSQPLLLLTARALIAGAIAMPVCCFLMAWRRQYRPLFVIPVSLLLAGGVLVVTGLMRP